MRPISFTTTALSGASTTNICGSQTPLGAGNLTINGALATAGVATLTSATAKPRYGLTIKISCAGSDAGRTFTVTGTKPGGGAQTEAIAGANSSNTSSALYWETITQIAVDAATAGAITVGANQVGATDWIPLDVYTPSPQTAIDVNITGTVNYSVTYTNEDPWDTTITQLEKVHPDSALTGASADQTAQATAVMRAVRLIINSGSGTAKMTITQQSTL